MSHTLSTTMFRLGSHGSLLWGRQPSSYFFNFRISVMNYVLTCFFLNFFYKKKLHVVEVVFHNYELRFNILLVLYRILKYKSLFARKEPVRLKFFHKWKLNRKMFKRAFYRAKTQRLALKNHAGIDFDFKGFCRAYRTSFNKNCSTHATKPLPRATYFMSDPAFLDTFQKVSRAQTTNFNNFFFSNILSTQKNAALPFNFKRYLNFFSYFDGTTRSLMHKTQRYLRDLFSFSKKFIFFFIRVSLAATKSSSLDTASGFSFFIKKNFFFYFIKFLKPYVSSDKPASPIVNFYLQVFSLIFPDFNKKLDTCAAALLSSAQKQKLRALLRRNYNNKKLAHESRLYSRWFSIFKFLVFSATTSMASGKLKKIIINTPLSYGASTSTLQDFRVFSNFFSKIFNFNQQAQVKNGFTYTKYPRTTQTYSFGAPGNYNMLMSTLQPSNAWVLSNIQKRDVSSFFYENDNAFNYLTRLTPAWSTETTLLPSLLTKQAQEQFRNSGYLPFNSSNIFLGSPNFLRDFVSSKLASFHTTPELDAIESEGRPTGHTLARSKDVRGLLLQDYLGNDLSSLDRSAYLNYEYVLLDINSRLFKVKAFKDGVLATHEYLTAPLATTEPVFNLLNTALFFDEYTAFDEGDSPLLHMYKNSDDYLRSLPDTSKVDTSLFKLTHFGKLLEVSSFFFKPYYSLQMLALTARVKKYTSEFNLSQKVSFRQVLRRKLGLLDKHNVPTSLRRLRVKNVGFRSDVFNSVNKVGLTQSTSQFWLYRKLTSVLRTLSWSQAYSVFTTSKTSANFNLLRGRRTRAIKFFQPHSTRYLSASYANTRFGKYGPSSFFFKSLFSKLNKNYSMTLADRAGFQLRFLNCMRLFATNGFRFRRTTKFRLLASGLNRVSGRNPAPKNYLFLAHNAATKGLPWLLDTNVRTRRLYGGRLHALETHIGPDEQELKAAQELLLASTDAARGPLNNLGAVSKAQKLKLLEMIDDLDTTWRDSGESLVQSVLYRDINTFDRSYNKFIRSAGEYDVTYLMFSLYRSFTHTLECLRNAANYSPIRHILFFNSNRPVTAGGLLLNSMSARGQVSSLKPKKESSKTFDHRSDSTKLSSFSSKKTFFQEEVIRLVESSEGLQPAKPSTQTTLSRFMGCPARGVRTRPSFISRKQATDTVYSSGLILKKGFASQENWHVRPHFEQLKSVRSYRLAPLSFWQSWLESLLLTVGGMQPMADNNAQISTAELLWAARLGYGAWLSNYIMKAYGTSVRRGAAYALNALNMRDRPLKYTRLKLRSKYTRQVYRYLTRSILKKKNIFFLNSSSTARLETLDFDLLSACSAALEQLVRPAANSVRSSFTYMLHTLEELARAEKLRWGYRAIFNLHRRRKRKSRFDYTNMFRQLHAKKNLLLLTKNQTQLIFAHIAPKQTPVCVVVNFFFRKSISFAEKLSKAFSLLAVKPTCAQKLQHTNLSDNVLIVLSTLTTGFGGFKATGSLYNKFTCLVSSANNVWFFQPFNRHRWLSVDGYLSALARISRFFTHFYSEERTPARVSTGPACSVYGVGKGSAFTAVAAAVHKPAGLGSEFSLFRTFLPQFLDKSSLRALTTSPRTYETKLVPKLVSRGGKHLLKFRSLAPRLRYTKLLGRKYTAKSMLTSFVGPHYLLNYNKNTRGGVSYFEHGVSRQLAYEKATRGSIRHKMEKPHPAQNTQKTLLIQRSQRKQNPVLLDKFCSKSSAQSACWTKKNKFYNKNRYQTTHLRKHGSNRKYYGGKNSYKKNRRESLLFLAHQHATTGYHFKKVSRAQERRASLNPRRLGARVCKFQLQAYNIGYVSKAVLTGAKNSSVYKSRFELVRSIFGKYAFPRSLAEIRVRRVTRYHKAPEHYTEGPKEEATASRRYMIGRVLGAPIAHALKFELLLAMRRQKSSVASKKILPRRLKKKKTRFVIDVPTFGAATSVISARNIRINSWKLKYLLGKVNVLKKLRHRARLLTRTPSISMRKLRRRARRQKYTPFFGEVTAPTYFGSCLGLASYAQKQALSRGARLGLIISHPFFKKIILRRVHLPLRKGTNNFSKYVQRRTRRMLANSLRYGSILGAYSALDFTSLRHKKSLIRKTFTQSWSLLPTSKFTAYACALQYKRKQPNWYSSYRTSTKLALVNPSFFDTQQAQVSIDLSKVFGRCNHHRQEFSTRNYQRVTTPHFLNKTYKKLHKHVAATEVSSFYKHLNTLVGGALTARYVNVLSAGQMSGTIWPRRYYEHLLFAANHKVKAAPRRRGNHVFVSRRANLLLSKVKKKALNKDRHFFFEAQGCTIRSLQAVGECTPLKNRKAPTTSRKHCVETGRGPDSTFFFKGTSASRKSIVLPGVHTLLARSSDYFKHTLPSYKDINLSNKCTTDLTSSLLLSYNQSAVLLDQKVLLQKNEMPTILLKRPDAAVAEILTASFVSSLARFSKGVSLNSLFSFKQLSYKEPMLLTNRRTSKVAFKARSRFNRPKVQAFVDSMHKTRKSKPLLQFSKFRLKPYRRAAYEEAYYKKGRSFVTRLTRNAGLNLVDNYRTLIQESPCARFGFTENAPVVDDTSFSRKNREHMGSSKKLSILRLLAEDTKMFDIIQYYHLGYYRNEARNSILELMRRLYKLQNRFRRKKFHPMRKIAAQPTASANKVTYMEPRYLLKKFFRESRVMKRFYLRTAAPQNLAILRRRDLAYNKYLSSFFRTGSAQPWALSSKRLQYHLRSEASCPRSVAKSARSNTTAFLVQFEELFKKHTSDKHSNVKAISPRITNLILRNIRRTYLRDFGTHTFYNRKAEFGDRLIHSLRRQGSRLPSVTLRLNKKRLLASKRQESTRMRVLSTIQSVGGVLAKRCKTPNTREDLYMRRQEQLKFKVPHVATNYKGFYNNAFKTTSSFITQHMKNCREFPANCAKAWFNRLKLDRLYNKKLKVHQHLYQKEINCTLVNQKTAPRFPHPAKKERIKRRSSKTCAQGAKKKMRLYTYLQPGRRAQAIGLSLLKSKEINLHTKTLIRLKQKGSKLLSPHTRNILSHYTGNRPKCAQFLIKKSNFLNEAYNIRTLFDGVRRSRRSTWFQVNGTQSNRRSFASSLLRINPASKRRQRRLLKVKKTAASFTTRKPKQKKYKQQLRTGTAAGSASSTTRTRASYLSRIQNFFNTKSIRAAKSSLLRLALLDTVFFEKFASTNYPLLNLIFTRTFRTLKRYCVAANKIKKLYTMTKKTRKLGRRPGKNKLLSSTVAARLLARFKRDVKSSASHKKKNNYHANLSSFLCNVYKKSSLFQRSWHNTTAASAHKGYTFFLRDNKVFLKKDLNLFRFLCNVQLPLPNNSVNSAPAVVMLGDMPLFLVSGICFKIIGSSRSTIDSLLSGKDNTAAGYFVRGLNPGTFKYMLGKQELVLQLHAELVYYYRKDCVYLFKKYTAESAMLTKVRFNSNTTGLKRVGANLSEFIQMSSRSAGAFTPHKSFKKRTAAHKYRTSALTSLLRGTPAWYNYVTSGFGSYPSVGTTDCGLPQMQDLIGAVGSTEARTRFRKFISKFETTKRLFSYVGAGIPAEHSNYGCDSVVREPHARNLTRAFSSFFKNAELLGTEAYTSDKKKTFYTLIALKLKNIGVTTIELDPYKRGAPSSVFKGFMNKVYDSLDQTPKVEADWYGKKLRPSATMLGTHTLGLKQNPVLRGRVRLLPSAAAAGSNGRISSPSNLDTPASYSLLRAYWHRRCTRLDALLDTVFFNLNAIFNQTKLSFLWPAVPKTVKLAASAADAHSSLGWRSLHAALLGFLGFKTFSTFSNNLFSYNILVDSEDTPSNFSEHVNPRFDFYGTVFTPTEQVGPFHGTSKRINYLYTDPSFNTGVIDFIFMRSTTAIKNRFWYDYFFLELRKSNPAGLSNHVVFMKSNFILVRNLVSYYSYGMSREERYGFDRPVTRSGIYRFWFYRKYQLKHFETFLQNIIGGLHPIKLEILDSRHFFRKSMHKQLHFVKDALSRVYVQRFNMLFSINYLTLLWCSVKLFNLSSVIDYLAKEFYNRRKQSFITSFINRVFRYSPFAGCRFRGIIVKISGKTSRRGPRKRALTYIKGSILKISSLSIRVNYVYRQVVSSFGVYGIKAWLYY